GLTYRSSAPDLGSYASSSGDWTVAGIGNAAAATLVITATVDAGTHGVTFVHSAEVAAADQADPVLGNDQDSARVRVQSADLALTVVADHARPNEGETLTCTVTLRNHGPDAATGVAASDVLPAGVTQVSSVASQGSYTPGTGAWSIGSIASGGSVTLGLIATVDLGTHGTSITNVASVIG